MSALYHLICLIIIIFQVFDFELSEDEMKKIKSLDRNLRVYKEPM